MRLEEQGVSAGVEAGQEVEFPERPLRVERLAESGAERRGRVVAAGDADVLSRFQARRAPARSAERRLLHAEAEPGQFAEALRPLQEFPGLDLPVDSGQAADVQSGAVALQVPEERAVRRQRLVGGRHRADSLAAGWRLRKRARRRYASGLAASPLWVPGTSALRAGSWSRV